MSRNPSSNGGITPLSRTRAASPRTHSRHEHETETDCPVAPQPPIRCGYCFRNPLIRNQTLAAPEFLRDSRSGPRFLKILPANQHEKCREKKTKKCHKTGLDGSDFDENLCGRRYFSWRIFLGGSRPDPALGRRRDVLKPPVSFSKFG